MPRSSRMRKPPMARAWTMHSGTTGSCPRTSTSSGSSSSAQVRGDGLDIAWRTAPRVGARDRLVVTGDTRVVAWAGDDPLVVLTPHGAVIAADGPALRRWGYWPWLLHAAAERAAGRDPGRFADWPGAPIVHRRAALIFAVAFAALAAAALLAFVVARRRARAEPDARLRFFAALQHKEWARPGM